MARFLIDKFKLPMTLLALTTACGSSEKVYSTDALDRYESNADPAAYAAHHFTFIKEQNDRTPQRPWEFYYKHCSENGNASYYSKTSYDCTAP
jgi:hypothetical protein